MIDLMFIIILGMAGWALLTAVGTLEYAAAHGPVPACRLSPPVGFEILPKNLVPNFAPKIYCKIYYDFFIFFCAF